MRKLLGLAGALWIITAAMVGAVVSHAPSPRLLAAKLFTYPDGTLCETPCLLGIRPGITPSDAAKGLIDKHPLSKIIVFFRDPHLRSPSGDVIYAGKPFEPYTFQIGGTVSDVIVYFNPRGRVEDQDSGSFSIVTLGDIIGSVRKPPGFVSIDLWETKGPAQHVWLTYTTPGFSLRPELILVSGERLSVFTPIDSVSIHAGNDAADDLCCNALHNAKWLGFKPLSNYVAAEEAFPPCCVG